MKIINVLYVYGYGSHAKDNRTVGLLRKHFPSNYNIMCFEYTQSDCAVARKEIYDFIEKNNIDLVIGSSLGGFIALTLEDVCRFVINPCWVPSIELPKIGAADDLISTYKPFENMINHPDMENRAIAVGFFGTHDELLERKYVEKFSSKYFTEIDIDSSHRLSENAITDTIVPYLDTYWNNMNKLDEYLNNVDNLDIYN